MATTFILSPIKKDGTSAIYVRVQCSNPPINVRQTTNLSIIPRIWERRSDSKYMDKYRDNESVQSTLRIVEAIRVTLDSKCSQGIALTNDDVRVIINEVLFSKQYEQERAEREEAERLAELEKKMTLNKFFKKFLDDIKDGTRMTEKGTLYAAGTIQSITQSYSHLMAYQEKVHKQFDFEDINMEFYNGYTAFLNKCGYKINTIGKNINWLKTILTIAISEGHHNTTTFQDRRFKGARVEVDSIYLTIEDLNKIRSVYLDNKPQGYTFARDLFMVGVWTAQRVSDYNNIQRENIKVHNKRTIEDVPDPESPGKTKAIIVEKELTVINLQQRKTGAKVAIPCSTELKKILEKYNFEMPHLADQNINDYMKDIAKWAGLTEKVMIESIQGGKKKVEWIPKYKLVHTHTARRTGATLMYLYGMDIYDIMKITGHSTPQTLKRYIKADSLEVIDKITDKYDYFD